MTTSIPNPNGNKVLQPHPQISKPTCLLICVLDGWGENLKHPRDEYNAIAQADTPTMDALRDTKSVGRWRLLKAHGTAVGLPSDGDMGNSEVGHNALGAGQIVDQGAKCVDKSLATGSLFDFQNGWKYIEAAAKGKTLHLIGLLSDGGVHSRYDQLMLLIKGAVERGVKKIRLHCLHDGRDVEDYTADKWIERLQTDITDINTNHNTDIKIASGGGRMKVTMDRYESDWNIVKRGWYAHVLGEAPHRFLYTQIKEGVQSLQRMSNGNDNNNGNNGKKLSDQQLEPWVAVDENAKPVGTIENGDAVVTFNFRADRMLEIAQAFEYSYI